MYTFVFIYFCQFVWFLSHANKISLPITDAKALSVWSVELLRKWRYCRRIYILNINYKKPVSTRFPPPNLLYINVRVRHLRLFHVCEATTMFDFQLRKFLLPWDEIKIPIKIRTLRRCSHTPRFHPTVHIAVKVTQNFLDVMHLANRR